MCIIDTISIFKFSTITVIINIGIVKAMPCVSLTSGGYKRVSLCVFIKHGFKKTFQLKVFIQHAGLFCRLGEIWVVWKQNDVRGTNNLWKKKKNQIENQAHPLSVLHSTHFLPVESLLNIISESVGYYFNYNTGAWIQCIVRSFAPSGTWVCAKIWSVQYGVLSRSIFKQLSVHFLTCFYSLFIAQTWH